MIRRLFFLGVACALLPAAAQAQGTCLLPKNVIADGRIETGTIANATSVFFGIQTTPGRSYSFHVSTALPDAWTAGATNITGFSDPATCATPIPGLVHTFSIDPAITNLSPTNNTGDRVSWTAASGIPFNGLYEFSISNTTGAPVAFTFTASETSLFSTAWSTNGSFDSFYSLYNTTNSTCNGTLILFNTAGTAVTTAAVTIPSQATTSTNTVTLGTPRNTTGTARFTHNCPPRAILAEAAIANFSISPTPYFQFVHFEPTRDAAH